MPLCIDTHTLYILIYTSNVNTFLFPYYNNYIYSYTYTFIQDTHTLYLLLYAPMTTRVYYPFSVHLSYILVRESYARICLSLPFYFLFLTITFISQEQIKQMRCHWKANSRIFNSHLDYLNQFSRFPCQNYA